MKEMTQDILENVRKSAKVLQKNVMEIAMMLTLGVTTVFHVIIYNEFYLQCPNISYNHPIPRFEEVLLIYFSFFYCH